VPLLNIQSQCACFADGLRNVWLLIVADVHESS
jgi:hypothetical protein